MIFTEIWLSAENNFYKVDVYMQRCKTCNEVANAKLEEKEYVERVVSKLYLLAGLRDAVIPSGMSKATKPHEENLCEACRMGKCKNKLASFPISYE